jgi:hypothetical protein
VLYRLRTVNPGTSPSSSLRDNHARGSVADFLRQHLKLGADLDLVTAYFTVFAFAGLTPDDVRFVGTSGIPSAD